VQSGRDVRPGQHLVTGCDAGWRTTRDRGPRRASRRSTRRARSARSTLGTFRPRATRVRSRANTTVAARRDAFGIRRTGVVPLELRAACPLSAVRSNVILRWSSSTPFLAEPLGTGCGARDEPADRTVHVACLLYFRPMPTTFDASSAMAEGVFVHLGRQTGQEVELHAPPPLRVRGVDCGVEVFFKDQLVDDLAQPPRPGFGCEREDRCGELSVSRVRCRR